MTIFRNRRDAGRQLADALVERVSTPVVLALPRGGVPVAAEVADRLAAPLDIVVVRKIGPPGNPELGVGAVGEGGVEVLEQATLDALGLVPDDLASVVAAERTEVERRVASMRSGADPVEIAGRDVVLVDDGLATGVTARAAAQILRRREVGHITVALPVGSSQGIAQLEPLVDEVVCLAPRSDLRAVGLWYQDFDQVGEDEVVATLAARRGS